MSASNESSNIESSNSSKLSIREKVSYGLGDTASNIIFQSVMLFLTYFYTDIFGLSPAVVGTLFLSVRVIDAVTDPLMGAICDRTKTKYGTYRPYLIWCAIPFAICSVLAFSTPDLSDQGKTIYAYVTYTLLMIAYTAINIPYSALGGVLTSDIKERVSVQSYRFVFGMLGGLIVTAATMYLVDYFGQGDKAKGYQMAMAAMSVLGVVLFVLCFAGTKERIAPEQNNSRPFKDDFKLLWQNDQWRILCIASLFLLTGMVLRNSLAIFYVQYYLKQPDMVTTFVTIGLLGNMLGCALAAPLAKRVNKIKAYITLQLISAVICMAGFFIEPSQVNTAILLHFLWGFFLQMATPLLWAKMADTIDYGHWKTGVRITAMVYSAIVFFIKMGVALGGALSGWLLAYYGYQANTEQTPEALNGIVMSFTIYSAIGSVLVAIVMRWYTLDNDKLEQIQQQIKLTPQT